MPKRSPAALQRQRLGKEADVLFLLKRQPALRKALKELDLRISDTGVLLAIPLQACPFDGCPLPFDLRDVIVKQPALKRTAPLKRTAARKRTKPA
jgi:hypothetical protein